MMNPGSSGAPSARLQKRLVYGLLGAAVVAAGLLVPLLAGGPAPAVPADAPAEAGTPLEGAELGGMLVRLVGGTAVVLALCVGVLWLLRRWLGGRPAASAVVPGLEVVESLLLVGPCRVLLVRAGGRYLLAGVGGNGLEVVLPVEGALDSDLVDADEAPAPPVAAAA